MLGMLLTPRDDLADTGYVGTALQGYGRGDRRVFPLVRASACTWGWGMPDLERHRHKVE